MLLQDAKARYHVQVGKNSGAYRTRYTTDSLAQATILYTGINLGPNYKKRLQDKFENRTLAKAKCIF